ncbi:hypothetical protein HYQ46_008963 [Verticillium longisporum]|nr:hypothetical protein HYQ46_008963 [Verticillium longisporum]
MPLPKVPLKLPEVVQAAFGRARSQGDLTYLETRVTILAPSSIPFQLRFAPALASKPTAPKERSSLCW